MEFGPTKNASGSDAVREVLARSVDNAGNGAARVSGNGELASALRAERKWRENYIGHLLKVQEFMLSSKEACMETAQAGLEAVYDTMHWKGTRLADVQVESAAGRFGTGSIQGNGQIDTFSLPVPRTSSAQTVLAADRAKEVKRAETVDAILEEIKGWVSQGLAEPDVLDNMSRMLRDHPEWLDLRGQRFVVLGASSQMGPTRTLLRLGATVIAVDLPGKRIWDKLAAIAKDSAGQLVFPTNANGEPGANVVEDMPYLVDWIASCIPEGERAVLGSYLYMDGASFVRVVVASDFIAREVQRLRPDVVLSYLCSPTEPFCVPEDAIEMANRTAEKRTWTHPGDMLLRALTLGFTLLPNEAIREPQSSRLLQDTYVPEQGPNYAFAKLIQRWRTMVSGPERAIANVAPASLTRSVMSNRLLRWGILGCERFGVVPFLPESANAIMTALMIHDLNHTDAKRAAYEIHPMVSYQSSAVHGGTWRCAFKTSSATKISVLVFAYNRVNPMARL